MRRTAAARAQRCSPTQAAARCAHVSARPQCLHPAAPAPGHLSQLRAAPRPRRVWQRTHSPPCAHALAAANSSASSPHHSLNVPPGRLLHVLGILSLRTAAAIAQAAPTVISMRPCGVCWAGLGYAGPSERADWRCIPDQGCWTAQLGAGAHEPRAGMDGARPIGPHSARQPVHAPTAQSRTHVDTVVRFCSPSSCPLILVTCAEPWTRGRAATASSQRRSCACVVPPGAC